MGFKFGYTKFSVGIVEIEISNIDTENYKGTVNIDVPTKLGVFRLELYSGINWQGVRGLSAKIGFTQPEPPDETHDEESEDPEYNEEESTDD